MYRLLTAGAALAVGLASAARGRPRLKEAGRSRRSPWPAATLALAAAVVVAAAALLAPAADAADAHAAPDERRAVHGGYEPTLHPSTLELSDYPAAGSGRTAELTFAVTYMGGGGGGSGAAPANQAPSWRQGPHPRVQLDVTGSEYPGLYRVTNITSDIGAAAPGVVFEPYDYRVEDTVAEPGRTYTVRAQVEFVADGFVPVYARGLDGDIVTVDVAASGGMSMPYDEYAAVREDYLDGVLAEAAPVSARERPLDAAAAAPAIEKRRGVPLAGLLGPPQGGPSPAAASAAADEPAVPPFDAVGTVVAGGYARNGTTMPVHGIQVCAYDMSLGAAGLVDTRLGTAAGGPACAYTGPDGRYEIRGIDGGDPDDATAADVFLKVVSRGYGGAITLAESASMVTPGERKSYERYYLYVDDSDAADVRIDYGGGGTLALDLDLSGAAAAAAAAGGMDGAARIISALSDGMAYFEGHGQAPSPLTVKWNHMHGASFFPDKPNNGAAYMPGAAVMWLNGMSGATHDDSLDRRVILHELGHHVHAVHDPGLEYECPRHYYHAKYDERCAWGEGWAQLVPHLVYDSAVIASGARGGQADIEAGSIRHGPPGSTVRYSDTFEASGRPIGEKVEGSVAAAMWDMADGAVHPLFDEAAGPAGRPAGRDDVAAGADALVSAFFGGTYDTFAEFYDGWEIGMRRHSAERVAVLHGMSFAIPAEEPYYRFAGELGGVFDRGLDGLRFRPNYVAISADGSTAAVTSLRGHGLQIVDVRSGENLGLYAARGYDSACMLERGMRILRCLLNETARTSADLGPGRFSSMDGVAIDPDSGRILVTDGYLDRVHVFGADGRHAGQLGRDGGGGGGAGGFVQPDGVAFLPGGVAAVADSGNGRVQTLEIGKGGGSGAALRRAGGFASQTPLDPPRLYTTQQLAAGPGGSLYAADYGRPSIWTFLPGPGGLPGSAARMDDPSLRGLGGIAVDPGGLAYVSEHVGGRVRVYDPGGLAGASAVAESESQLDGLPLAVRTVRQGAEAFVDEFGSRGRYAWQLAAPHGVALGPPDPETGDVRVYVADRNGVKVYEKDRKPPAATSVWSHTLDGTATAGDTVEIAVNFSERVTVEGEPALMLALAQPGAAEAAAANETGPAVAPAPSAAYASGSGSPTLTFNYTVPPAAAGGGPGYLDHAGPGSLVLAAGASIADGGGNRANLTLPPRGSAASLAANAALWIDPGGQGAGPPVRIDRVPTVHAVEGRAVRLALNATAAAGGENVSYSWAGLPDGAAAGAGGAFSWTPAEDQDGVHELAATATALGGPGAGSHVRAVRILVAEDNAPPAIREIPDVHGVELAEIRFDVDASDADLPAQRLRYGLERSGAPFAAAMLPNGTFVWTPSVYDGGTHRFNVSVSDGFGHGGGGGGARGARAGTSFAAFSATVAEAPQPPPYVVRVSSQRDGTYGAGDTVGILVEFSARVIVRGSPELRLDAGGGGGQPPALAAYASGSRTSILAFEYAVEHGHDTGRLEYAGADALSVGAGIRAASGEAAELALPAPGSPGSLSSTSHVSVATTVPVLEIGVLGGPPGAAQAAQLAAADFNAGSQGLLLGVVTYPLRPGQAAGDALRAAHAGGAGGGGGGPDLYIAGLADRDLHDAMQYAAESGIVLVGTGSSAPSLAVEGDRTFRLRPSDAMQAAALARLAHGAGAESVHAVLENATYGPVAGGSLEVPPPPGRFSHGFAAALADSAIPGLESTVVLGGDGGRGAAAAAAAAALDGAVGAGAAPAAVIYLGSPGGLAALAEAAGGYPALGSALWFASDLSAGSHLLSGAGSPAAEFAARVGLEAVQWRAPENDLARGIDSRLPHGEPGTVQDYAAYDAAALLGMAASGGDGASAAVVADGLPAAAAEYVGALGDIALDSAGDLWVPAEYDVWAVVQAGGQAGGQGGAPEWARRAGAADEARACSITLERAKIDYGPIDPGQTSRPHLQAIANTGQLPFAGVELQATPWHVGSPGECAPGDLPSLPAGLSEIRTELGGGFADLAARGAVVAEGLEAGSRAPLWYRLNLAEHASLPQAEISQCVTYVARCR